MISHERFGAMDINYMKLSPSFLFALNKEQKKTLNLVLF